MNILLLLTLCYGALLGVGRGLDLALGTDPATGLCTAGPVWWRFLALGAGVLLSLGAGWRASGENFRRRTNMEKEQLSGFVTAGVVGKFLKVLDNFERAEASAAKATDMEGVITGMQKIRRQFEDTFTALKVEEIPAQDQKFDPQFHEAVMRGHNPEIEDEIIDLVLEKGYKLGDRVIRHSKVRVNSNE